MPWRHTAGSLSFATGCGLLGRRTLETTARRRLLRLTALHPVGVALFPFLSFYSANRGRLLPGDPTLPALLAFNFVVAAVAFAVFAAILRNVRKAALATSISLIVFFAYGPILAVLRAVAKVPPTSMVAQVVLLAVGIGVVVFSLLLLRRAGEERIARSTRVFAAVAAILVLMPLVTVVVYRSGRDQARAPKVSAPAAVEDADLPEVLPDVYYIVLDSYPRADVLKDILRYDDSRLIDGLKKRGFYVASRSNANYAHTFLSLPSTLNMRYLDELPKKLGAGSTDNTVPLLMIEDNKIVPVMKSLGYKFANVGSGWFQTVRSKYADVPFTTQGSSLRVGPFDFGLDETSIVYLQNTALRPVIERRIRSSLQKTVLNAFDALERIPAIKDPTFTFAHITIPHAPFLFDSEGNWVDNAVIEASGDVYEDRPHFVEQVEYTSRKALEVVGTILEKSPDPPIIVMAGDHGSTTLLGHPDKWGPPKEMGPDAVRERMGILNAYYFPDKSYDKLYPTITPVNSFRLILSEYFGLDYPLLPDKSYYSHYQAFFRYYDVTSFVRDGKRPDWAR